LGLLDRGAAREDEKRKGHERNAKNHAGELITRMVPRDTRQRSREQVVLGDTSTPADWAMHELQ
jgi:hypothetical protein